jgi:hypothetical protein
MFEALIHLSEYTNRRNFHYWCQKNPLEIDKLHLHSIKVSTVVRCNIFHHNQTYFFENQQHETVTLNTERYQDMLENFLAPKIHHLCIQNIWFQKDGATSHIDTTPMDMVWNIFPGRLISRFGDIIWPPRFPDLTVSLIFIWSTL